MKTINVFLGILVVFSAIAYLFQVNSLATKGYEIKELEQKLEALMETKRDLETRSLELQSMSVISSKVQEMNMVPIENARLISPEDSVAVKR